LVLWSECLHWCGEVLGERIRSLDKETFSNSNNVPLLTGARGALVDKLRTVKVQVRYDF
jgi:hypothetical protein